jgi:hypothetical protein
MFPNSDHNILDPAGWYGSALSIGGLNWSDTNSNFIGRLDEVKVWNITKDANDFAILDQQFPPRIDRVEGTIGYDWLRLTFTEGVYSDTGETGALVGSDFLLSASGNTITGVTHTLGESTAVITLEAPLADIGSGTLAVNDSAIFDEYDTPATTDPVIIVKVPSSAEITTVEGIPGDNRLFVTFSGSVYANTGQTGALVDSDFLLSASGQTITDVTHTAGGSTAVITMNLPLGAADIDSSTVAAIAYSIYNEYDDPMETSPVAITAMANTPSITVVQGVVGHDKVSVWFSERVYANSDATGALDKFDFVFTDAGDGKSIIAVEHTPGTVTATLTLDDTVKDADRNVATLAAAGGSIYDITGYSAPTNEEVFLTESTNVSSILMAEGVIGSNKLKVTFESQVYANDDETGALQPLDFTFTDGNIDGAASILTVSHTAGSPVTIITLDTDLILGDIGSDSIAAASDSIFGPSAGNFPLGTGTVTISAQTAPSITKVEGAVGYDQVLVSFTEGVYTGSGRSGALVPADFSYGNNFVGGATGIDSVSHTAGNSTAIITLNSTLDANDKDTDTIAAVGSEIFNSADNPAGTAAVAIAANDCTAWGASFPIENVPQYADWPANPPADGEIEDETGLLSGTVYTPTIAFPNVDNDWFTGDEGQGTGIRVWNDDICLISPRAFTIEARVKPTRVDNGTTNEFNRIFERRRTYLVTIINTDYRGNDIPQYMDKASIEVKYRVGSRHNCPHPQWPTDPEDRISVWTHQISSSIEDYPLYNDHWYLIRVVFNSDKADLAVEITGSHNGIDNQAILTDSTKSWAPDALIGKIVYNITDGSSGTITDNDETTVTTAALLGGIEGDWDSWDDYEISIIDGSNGTPVDIFIDDQGTDGLNNPNPTPGDPTLNPDDEQWPGYANASQKINESSSCRWGALPGEYNSDTGIDNNSSIGTNWNNSAQRFDGQIDWVTWQPVADYWGVTDPPK